MSIKAVIFDMDGLLVASEVVSYEVWRRLLESFGIPFSKDFYAENCSGKTSANGVGYLTELFHLAWDPDAVLTEIDELEYDLAGTVELKKGAKEILGYLRAHRYKTALASSSLERRASVILDRHGLRPYFDAIVLGSEVEHGKPAPDIFLEAARRLQEDPKDCLVLEDSEAGIQAAFSGGIPVVCVPDMRRPSPDCARKAVRVEDSLLDVVGYLEQGSHRISGARLS